MRNDAWEIRTRAAGGPAADALRLRERNEMRRRRARAREAKGLPPANPRMQGSFIEDRCPPVARMIDHIRFLWYSTAHEAMGSRAQARLWRERAERLIEVRRESGGNAKRAAKVLPRAVNATS